MIGKIAVIRGCWWCPYRAIDSTLKVYNGEDEERDSSVAYCGYHKVGYDGTQTRIENALAVVDETGCVGIDRPENCPLPIGDDGRK